MSSLTSNKVLLYAFVALAIVCVVASIFTMSFSLFFVTVVVCIVVYIVYRIALGQKQRRLQERERTQAAIGDDDNDNDDDGGDADDDGVDDIDGEGEDSVENEVYQALPMPVVVHAPTAQLVIDKSLQKPRRRRKKKRNPSPEDIERARLLSLRNKPSRAQKTYNRVNKTRGPNTLQSSNARVITKLSGRKQAFSDMRVDKFASGNELHARRRRPNRAKDSSGYGQLSSWRSDPNRSISENAARRAMVHGAILPEPKHARRRLMRGILKRFPLRPAPGMVRIPEGEELPCTWNNNNNNN
jgi:Ca2+/Na+ antiporter